MRRLLSRRLAQLAPLVLATLLVVAPRARAQDQPVTRPELRLDATAARASRLDASLGAVVPVGIYVRLALTAGGGVARAGDASHPAARADAIARFELDPLKQHTRGFYLGGGASFLARDGDRGRVYLALVAGTELEQRGGWVPTIEAGIGGGARVGIALRRAMQAWR